MEANRNNNNTGFDASYKAHLEKNGGYDGGSEHSSDVSVASSTLSETPFLKPIDTLTEADGLLTRVSARCQTLTDWIKGEKTISLEKLCSVGQIIKVLRNCTEYALIFINRAFKDASGAESQRQHDMLVSRAETNLESLRNISDLLPDLYQDRVLLDLESSDSS